MKTLKYLSAAAMLLTVGTLWAADEPAMPDKPSFSATHSVTYTAPVEAINHDTREVTLRLEDGELFTFTAGEEVRNLDQVEVGDVVVTDYEETLSIEVVANEGMEPGASSVSTVARAKEGEKPGIAAMDKTTITATVEEINLENNTFKLKEPDGEITQYVARDPENLKRAEVGDHVIMTITQSMAISVTEKPAE